jgi:hypothetical protein
MKRRLLSLCLISQVMIFCLLIFFGCDSAEKARDELTGDRAVKQYHKSRKEIEKITERQRERYGAIQEDEEHGNKNK